MVLFTLVHMCFVLLTKVVITDWTLSYKLTPTEGMSLSSALQPGYKLIFSTSKYADSRVCGMGPDFRMLLFWLLVFTSFSLVLHRQIVQSTSVLVAWQQIQGEMVRLIPTSYTVSFWMRSFVRSFSAGRSPAYSGLQHVGCQ